MITSEVIITIIKGFLISYLDSFDSFILTYRHQIYWPLLGVFWAFNIHFFRKLRVRRKELHEEFSVIIDNVIIDLHKRIAYCQSRGHASQTRLLKELEELITVQQEFNYHRGLPEIDAHFKRWEEELIRCHAQLKKVLQV